MSIGGGGQAYQPPPVPDIPPPPHVATQADSSVQAAGDRAADAGRRAGLASTIMTGPQGDLTQPNTAKQTLGG